MIFDADSKIYTKVAMGKPLSSILETFVTCSLKSGIETKFKNNVFGIVYNPGQVLSLKQILWGHESETCFKHSRFC